MTTETELYRLAQRGDTNMPEDILAQRIGTALHEAAHFLVAAREGVEVHDIAVASVKGRGPTTGVLGWVRLWPARTNLIEARCFLAGTAHEVLLQRWGVTHSNDALGAARWFVEHICREGLTRQQWDDIPPKVLQEEIDFLRARWPLIVDIAAGFLAAQKGRGSGIPGKAGARLYAMAQARMSEISDAQYGGGLRHTLPPAETEEHVQREMARALNSPAIRALDQTLARHFAALA